MDFIVAVNNFGDTRSGGLAGPMGLFIIVLLSVATVFLIRNMNKRLRRLPDSFPDARAEAREAEVARLEADLAAGTGGPAGAAAGSGVEGGAGTTAESGVVSNADGKVAAKVDGRAAGKPATKADSDAQGKAGTAAAANSGSKTKRKSGGKATGGTGGTGR